MTSAAALTALADRHALEVWFEPDAEIVRLRGAAGTVVEQAQGVAVHLPTPLTPASRALVADTLRSVRADFGPALGLAERLARPAAPSTRQPGWPGVDALLDALEVGDGEAQCGHSPWSLRVAAGGGVASVEVTESWQDGACIEPSAAWVRAAARWNPRSDGRVAVAATVCGRIDFDTLSRAGRLDDDAQRALDQWERGLTTNAEAWLALARTLLGVQPGRMVARG